MNMQRKGPQLFPSDQRRLKDLGERFRLARLRRKFSMEMVATRAGISRTSLYKVERGDPDEPARTARRERRGQASPYHTFRVRRFDRRGATRRFYASALTLLDKTPGEEASYLELLEFISNHGRRLERRQSLELLPKCA